MWGTEISRIFSFTQDDHKLTLDELHRKYGTDLTRVSLVKCYESKIICMHL